MISRTVALRFPNDHGVVGSELCAALRAYTAVHRELYAVQPTSDSLVCSIR